jgi:hypothetical protein
MENKDLTVRVKHLIQFLQENFDPEARVILDRDGWTNYDYDVTNEIDLIKERGVFDAWQDDLIINN